MKWRDAGETGGFGPESQPSAGASPASARDAAGGAVLGAELAQEAASRARSLRNAVGTTMIAAVLAFAAIAASPEGHFLPRLLDGIATVCFLWASWAILRGAWLLGTGWKAAFFVCWLLGLPLLVFAVLVFVKLRRMSPAGGRPAGHAGPPRSPRPRVIEHGA